MSVPSRITPEQALEMARLARRGYSTRMIAEKFGLSKAQAARVISAHAVRGLARRSP